LLQKSGDDFHMILFFSGSIHVLAFFHSAAQLGYVGD